MTLSQFRRVCACVLTVSDSDQTIYIYTNSNLILTHRINCIWRWKNPNFPEIHSSLGWFTFLFSIFFFLFVSHSFELNTQNCNGKQQSDADREIMWWINMSFDESHLIPIFFRRSHGLWMDILLDSFEMKLKWELIFFASITLTFEFICWISPRYWSPKSCTSWIFFFFYSFLD